MNEINGYAAEDMYPGKPESLLTNFTADVMKNFPAQKELNYSIDLALMNVEGHRAPIYKGEITTGDLFSTYPFENELVLLEIEGRYLRMLLEEYAKAGGGGISWNAKITIENNKLKEALIDSQPLDDNKTYTIITLDYLAEGNDGMDALVHANSIVPTGVLLRDYITGYIKKRSEYGEEIYAATDGRITIE
ncbi:MAG: 5'-nucleotidase C-terminal domain-containing protein [Candidatus Azobacteroides sp.]|nr:5'-nucleotidase C-terminal domain-containing protein [Candidatus Azobacteroides sp.]